jgi:glycosyltransferase involved in cell wall biosynthesis
MKIGVWQPKRYETSVRIYSENVSQHLKEFGHELIFFGQGDAIPDADIIWDPTCTGARYPNRGILRSPLPWIVTVHGASNLSLPLHYTFTSALNKLKGFYINQKRKLMWSIYKYKVSHIITVSKYAKEELVEHLNIEPHLISIIYHGYDDNHFYRQSGPKEYLLHVSVYQPKKNVDRIIEAYQSIKEDKLPMMIICPGYPHVIEDKKMMMINMSVERKQVAKYMKGAYSFVFPSIHESFGMPLLEAMACGVPVITSNTTACPEIVRDAGILVDPHSAIELSAAMKNMMQDKALHDSLSKNALERAKDFSWEKTARLHEELFKRHLVQNFVN